MASVLFMKQMSDQVTSEVKISSLRTSGKELPWDDEKIPGYIADKIYVKHLDGPLFFGFAPAFQELAKTLPDIRVVIFDMEKVPLIDQTGLYAMEEVIMALEVRGIAVIMTGLREQPKLMLRRINLIPGLIPEQCLFPTFAKCIEWLDEELSGLEKADMHQFFDDLNDREKLKLLLMCRI